MKKLIEQTKQLISIPSTADNPEALKEALEFVRNIVSGQPGITIERFERKGKPSFLAYKNGPRPKKFDVLLNGHVDVVPDKAESFTPIEKDGKLYGRGALDMKGTVIALTDAFCEMVGQVPYNLGLQIVSDEEIGGYDGVRLQIDDGVRADFVVVGEYSNERNTIYNAARGVCWTEIGFKGKTAHGAHLWKGANAVVKAGEFAAAVLKRYPTPDKETWTTTASIASLSTPNETYNKVPDNAILKIDFRFTQEDPVFESRESLEKFIRSLDPCAELLSVSVFEPAVNVEELNPYVQGLSAAMTKFTNQQPQFLGRPGGSDGRHFALVNNDVVEFGLYGDHSHTDNEYVELNSFEEYGKIIREFLKNPKPDAAAQAETNDPEEPLRLQLLSKLVEMPTVSGEFKSNNSAMAFIADFLRTRGMYVEPFEHEGYRSIVASTRSGNRKPSVLLTAHTDVVPAKNDSYKLTRDGDKLIGRGVIDMKFAIASYLELVDKLKDDLEAYDFGILITSDEEIGGRHGTAAILDQLKLQPGVAIVPDGGDDWKVERFAKGVQWVKITANGKPGHASRPWEGESAISKLITVLQEIEKLVPADPNREDTMLTIGTITGGTTPNQIPSEASAMLDIRTGSLEDHKNMIPNIQAICQKYGATCEAPVNDVPSINDPKNAYIKPFIDLITKVTGKNHGTSLSYGATDGRFFAAKNIPSIIVVPPSGGRHQDDEWMSAKGLEQFCIILEQYIKKMSTPESNPKEPKLNDIRHLAKNLNAYNEPAYVWFASYAAGLSKEHFNYSITGGVHPGTSVAYKGCRDHTLPLKDAFISLPYELYFAGESETWGGATAAIDTKRNPQARTIAHAYLITVGQLEDIAAHKNMQNPDSIRLPLSKAMQQGSAAIAIEQQDGNDDTPYNELLYCGRRDGYPVFSITSLRRHLPHKAPGESYTRALCKGLAENTQMNVKALVDYIMERPGVAGHYKKQTVTDLFDQPSDS